MEANNSNRNRLLYPFQNEYPSDHESGQEGDFEDKSFLSDSNDFGPASRPHNNSESPSANITPDKAVKVKLRNNASKQKEEREKSDLQRTDENINEIDEAIK